jgi:hypothetical protein
MLLGILNMFFLIGLRYWFQDLKIKMSKSKWSVLLFYWFTLNITIAGAFTLIGENERTAGLRFLAFFSIPMFLGGAVIVRWIASGRKPRINTITETNKD